MAADSGRDVPKGRRLSEAEVAELTVLVTRGQAEALERLACRHGLTVGQLARRLLWDFLAQSAGDPRATPGSKTRPGL